MSRKFKELSDWIMEDHASYRMKINGDPIKDRVAFIEKTPRVKVDRYSCGIQSPNGIGGTLPEGDIWIAGPRGHAPEYGTYKPSRDWCDKMLELLGWE